MAVAALNLRGLNLLAGLGKTFTVIDPDVGEGEVTFAPIDPKKEQHRRQLADYLLKGGLLSDSCFKSSWATFWRFERRSLGCFWRPSRRPTFHPQRRRTAEGGERGN